jgi:hypothetical protein
VLSESCLVELLGWEDFGSSLNWSKNDESGAIEKLH